MKETAISADLKQDYFLWGTVACCTNIFSQIFSIQNHSCDLEEWDTKIL